MTPAVIAGVLLGVVVLLWPRGTQAPAAAARAILEADHHDTPRPVSWWNRDLSWSALRRSPRHAGVPVGFLDAMTAALGAGLTPAEAVRVAAHEHSEHHSVRADDDWLQPVLDSADAGRPLGSAWESVARRGGDPDIAALARAWVISERLGAPLADAVAGAAEMSRARTARAAAITSATAGATATSTLLTLLPLGGIGLAAIVGVGPVRLYTHPLSLLSLGIGVVLLVLGRWWVQRLIRAVAAPG